MSVSSTFAKAATHMAADPVHRRVIQKAVDSHDIAVNGMKDLQYRSWEVSRTQAGATKEWCLAHLPELLEQFEAKITARGAQVHWAEDAGQARQLFLEIAQRHQARRVVKSKSMTTEELELNELMEEHGIEAIETDLGEMICQLVHEKPYHIVTPAMHLTKEQIAERFHETLGTPLECTAEELTMVAREHLRQAYVTADIGVSGANFILAEDGAIALTENEGNARLSISCPPVHVVFAGIEKVLPSSAWLPHFWPLLATSGTGQQVTCYSSLVRGPRQPGEIDGPEEMHIILIDNGRTRLYADEKAREALRCIRCGACLNVCPVYRGIGGHAYGVTYQGPIGKVITPHLMGFAEYGFLSGASSLCGACSDVCPVHIDLHHLLLHNRAVANEQQTNDAEWRAALKVWAWVNGSRTRLERFRAVLKGGAGLLKLPLGKAQAQRVPDLAPRSFADLWQSGDLNATSKTREARP
jgi:L-lactate dehydrogenase complex protein LldF